MGSNAEDVAALAAALTTAIGQATAQLRESGPGGEFSENVRHARDLHTRLLETLLDAEPAIDERVRGLCDTIGNRIDNLEAALRDGGGG